MIPAIRAVPGLRDILVGRVGPGDMGDRIVASVWPAAASDAACDPDLEQSAFDPPLLAASSERTVEIFRLAVDERWPDGRHAAILRVSRGRVRAGELERYVEIAASGARSDHARGGPLAFYLATLPPDRFVSLSAWPDWSAIEAATGADTTTPVTTRHDELMLDFAAEHFEAVDGLVAIEA